MQGLVIPCGPSRLYLLCTRQAASLSSAYRAGKTDRMAGWMDKEWERLKVWFLWVCRFTKYSATALAKYVLGELCCLVSVFFNWSDRTFMLCQKKMFTASVCQPSISFGYKHWAAKLWCMVKARKCMMLMLTFGDDEQVGNTARSNKVSWYANEEQIKGKICVETKCYQMLL